MRGLLSLATGLAAFLALRGLVLAMGVDLAKVAESPAPVVAALIGVGGAVAGALGGFALWLAQDRAKRRDAAETATARRRKVVIALRAEIALSAETLALSFDPATAGAMRDAYCAQILAARRGEHAMPMGVTLDDYAVFDQIRPDLSELPDYAIRAVVRYYQTDRYVTKMIEGFANGGFSGLTRERQLKSIDSYFDLGFSALEAAIVARCALDAALAERPAFNEAQVAEQCSKADRRMLARLRGRKPFDPPATAMAARNRVLKPRV